MGQEARLDTVTRGNRTVTATTAQEQQGKVHPYQVEDPFADVDTALDDVVPIPMPPLSHPGADQVHPWED
jgi:hypothetical protein